MASFPDFVIDLTEKELHPEWNYYDFDDSLINSLDFDYLRVLKNQGFLTEAMLKGNKMEFSGVFLSETQDKKPFFEKRRRRMKRIRMNLMKRLKKRRQKTRNHIPIKKGHNGEEVELIKRSKKHRIVIKFEDNFEANSEIKGNKELISNKPNGIQIKSKNPASNYELSPQYSSNSESESNSENDHRELIFNKVKGHLANSNFNPTYHNFLSFMESTFSLNSQESENFLLMKALLDVHHQTPRKSPFEKSREIIKNLPLIPAQPHSLPVLNQALDLDYNLLHLNVDIDFTVRQFNKNFRRIVSYNEEKSLNSLSLHFKMPREDLNELFNSVSRYFPDILEVFKGNSKLAWTKEEDDLLREGKPLGRDRGRIMRRRRFFGLF